MNRKIISYLALCKKAGLLLSGESGCVNALRSGSAKLIMVAVDASDNTKKKFCNKSFYYEVPYFSVYTKEEISRAIGEHNRSTIAVIDENLALKIIDSLD